MRAADELLFIATEIDCIVSDYNTKQQELEQEHFSRIAELQRFRAAELDEARTKFQTAFVEFLQAKKLKLVLRINGNTSIVLSKLSHSTLIDLHQALSIKDAYITLNSTVDYDPVKEFMVYDFKDPVSGVVHVEKNWFFSTHEMQDRYSYLFMSDADVKSAFQQASTA